MLQFVSFSRINLAYSDVTLNLLFQVVLYKNVRLSFNLLIDSLKFRIFQGLFTVQLSMFIANASHWLCGSFNLTRCCHLSATAYLLYHSANRLSTTFLFSFASFEAVARASFPIRNQLDQYISHRLFCQHFFRLFLNCFNNSENMSIKQAEKEGFEPSRRY